MNIGNNLSGTIDVFNIKLTEKTEGAALNPQGMDQQNMDKSQEEKVDLDSFQGLLKNVNKEMEPYNTQLEFSVHEKTRQVMIKIINTSTKETIREIPSEKLMDIMANLIEVSGILVDIKA